MVKGCPPMMIGGGIPLVVGSDAWGVSPATKVEGEWVLAMITVGCLPMMFEGACR